MAPGSLPPTALLGHALARESRRAFRPLPILEAAYAAAEVPVAANRRP